MTEEKEQLQIINVNTPCSVAAPNSFDFVPENWIKWRKRFDRYMAVSDSANKSDRDKVDMLLYLMGEKAEDLAIQLSINVDGNTCTIEEALKKIDDHFTPKRNPVYARYKFNSRRQEPGETVDDYIRELHVLAEVCDFKDFKEEMIRDNLVVGVNSKKARERMLLDVSLTLEKAVQPQCIEHKYNLKEDILLEKQPMRAWQKVGIDLFHYNNTWYMVIIDFYSRYLDVKKLNNLTENNIIEQCKDIFSKFGIPEIVRTDCGTQFKAGFRKFAKEYNFEHITSSPYYSQSNGCAESAVKIAKSLLKKNQDIHMALLIYRNTPLDFGYSPAELMFKRKLRDNLPRLPEELQKTVHSKLEFKKKELEKKEKIQKYYNKRHKTKNLKDLVKGEKVWVIDLKIYGTVEKKATEPRSYIISTERGMFRRNRWHLIPSPHIKDVSLPSYSQSSNEQEIRDNNGSNFDNKIRKKNVCEERSNENEGENPKKSHMAPSENIVTVDPDCDSDIGRENDCGIQDNAEENKHSLRKRNPPKWLEDYVL